MFNWFGTKNSPVELSQKTIDNLIERIEILESIDREYLGEQSRTGNMVTMIIAKDKSLKIRTKSFEFIDMAEETVIKLRDFLVKNFPLEPKTTLEGTEAVKFIEKTKEETNV